MMAIQTLTTTLGDIRYGNVSAMDHCLWLLACIAFMTGDFIRIITSHQTFHLIPMSAVFQVITLYLSDNRRKVKKESDKVKTH